MDTPKKEGGDETTMEEEKGQKSRMAKEERALRNAIANEIKKEKNRVHKYYASKGDITQEQLVRINIFSLCEDIARGGK